jgi:hypothetical protein
MNSATNTEHNMNTQITKLLREEIQGCLQSAAEEGYMTQISSPAHKSHHVSMQQYWLDCAETASRELAALAA